MFRSVRSVMVFTPDPEQAARWWAGILDSDVHLDRDGDSIFAWLDIADTEFAFHPADDERNPRGGSPVPYWSVDDLSAARERLLTAGCTHHRGPLEVGPDRRICQIVDPFGTVIGLDGP